MPTRDNLHDFFNGLIVAALAAAPSGASTRLQAAPSLAQGVRARARAAARCAHGVRRERLPCCWRRDRLQKRWLRASGAGCSWTLRPLWRQARLFLLGHALLEKLVSSRKAITAHVYQAPTAIKKEAMFDTRRWRADLQRAMARGQALQSPADSGRAGLVPPRTRTFASMTTPWFSVARASRRDTRHTRPVEAPRLPTFSARRTCPRPNLTSP